MDKRNYNCIIIQEQVSGRTSTVVTYERALELVGIEVDVDDWKRVTLDGISYRYVQVLQGGNNLTVVQRISKGDVNQSDIDQIIEYMDNDGEGMVSLVWELNRQDKILRNMVSLGVVLVIATLIITII